MTSRLGFLLCLFAVSMPVVAQETPTISDAEVEKAIALGISKNPGDYIATGSPGMYDVAVLGRLGRIAFAAYQAKRAYKSLTVATVSADLRRDEIVVEVTPRTPVRNLIAGGFVVAAPVTHVVLRAADGSLMQPIEITPVPQEWSNALGGRFSSIGATARFPSLPAGDFEVVLVTSDGERVHRVRGGDRKRLQ